MDILRFTRRRSYLKFSVLTAITFLVVIAVGCGTQQKVRRLNLIEIPDMLRLPEDKTSFHAEYDIGKTHRDTLMVTDKDGKKFIIMNAIKDEGGEMVANEILDAAYVTARFRNVADRHGKINLEFQIIVPKFLIDSRWQLRLHPDIFVLGDSIRSDGITITGRGYRKAQLRGYQQYERFLSTIIGDSTKFIDVRQLEIFLRRNIPSLYAMKTDSTKITDEEFASLYGATEREAIEHYTNRIAVRHNEKRKAKREKMYRHYVKSPITTEGVRLDTVITDTDGDLIYNYVQTIASRPQLKRVDIALSGEIWEEDRRVYSISGGEPLTFYISSIAALIDSSTRYLEKVIDRRADASTACYIEFGSGQSNVDLSLGHNKEETGRVRDNLAAILQNIEYDLDSIVVTAGCSPEGSWNYNERLSLKRSESVCEYFRKWMKEFSDSMKLEKGVSIDHEGEIFLENEPDIHDIEFIPKNIPENWTLLDFMIRNDTLMTETQKEAYFAIRLITDNDEREKALSGMPYYRRLREEMYPYLRMVRFDLHLHRKGMVKDTIHTTEPDTAYMRGVRAISEMDYKTALTILRPYGDYNTALAYCLLDYNASAIGILEPMTKTAKIHYLLAILYSRRGEREKAVRHYLDACRTDNSYRHRGNLDPEISALIKAYKLNNEDL